MSRKQQTSLLILAFIAIALHAHSSVRYVSVVIAAEPLPIRSLKSGEDETPRMLLDSHQGMDSSPFQGSSVSPETYRKEPAVFSQLDSATSRAKWTKSILDGLPDKPWQTIAYDGSLSNGCTFKDGIAILTCIGADGKRTFVAINSTPWLEQIEIHLSEAPKMDSPLSLPELKMTKGDAIKPLPQHDVLRFQLPAMTSSHWSWTDSKSALILKWSHDSSQEGVDQMNDRIAVISETIQRMTNFRTDFGFQLDGGFESTDIEQIRQLPSSSITWLLSLNPTVTWSKSTTHVRSAAHSLQYESSNEQGNGWIQTKSIPRRVTWPLAVEVWIRFDDQPKRPQVRLITTGTLSNNKLVEAKEIVESDQNHGAADVWKRYEFPTLRNRIHSETPLALSPAEMLQWTIEVSGPGRLWIDDLGMSPLVLTEEERRLLRSQLFVAKRELEQRQPLKALEWIESPLVTHILKQAQQCPPDFLKPIIRTGKPIAASKRTSFLQSTRAWFWKPTPSDLEPGKVRLSKGNPTLPTQPFNR